MNLIPPIPMEWVTIFDIKRNLNTVRKRLIQTKLNAADLRKQHLLQRTSIMDIQNNKSSSK